MKHFELSIEGSLVRVRRGGVAIDDMAAFLADFAEVNERLERLYTTEPQIRVLVDLRNAVGRNDPDFESAVAPHRKRMFTGGGHLAVLVRSQVGAMQVTRHLQLDGAPDIPVFVSEADAEAWATG